MTDTRHDDTTRRTLDDFQTCADVINQPGRPVADLPFALTPPHSKAADAIPRGLPWDTIDTTTD